jgi:rod shape-determining protein MreC
MDHTPPPFFKRGPAPLVRLFFFATLSLAMLVIDARFRYVEGLRSWLALAAYPIQRAALLPFGCAPRRWSIHRTRSAIRRRRPRLRSCGASSTPASASS